VEKAHPDVFNILLQVLDDGRLTDGQGRTVDFRNTVIVMTSNLGSHQIQDMSADDSPEAYTQMKAAVMGVVQAHFRPEFINRLDDIVVFHPLDKQQIKQIARIQMRGLEKRLAERGLKLAVSDAAFDLLGNVGFDPVYGARPLKRAIQRSWKTRWRSRSCPGPSSTAIPSKSATTAVAWCSPRREPRGAA
jgi:ATP-dependent Clp protease ATP-binding subunit ClpB